MTCPTVTDGAANVISLEHYAQVRVKCEMRKCPRYLTSQVRCSNCVRASILIYDRMTHLHKKGHLKSVTPLCVRCLWVGASIYSHWLLFWHTETSAEAKNWAPHVDSRWKPCNEMAPGTHSVCAEIRWIIVWNSLDGYVVVRFLLHLKTCPNGYLLIS